MPVVTINALELEEKQKKIVAREYTRILSRITNVPEGNIYIFFGGYPLSGIAAGGVLNSDLPDSVLKNFNIKYSKHLEKAETITVLTRMKAKRGKEEEAEKVTLKFLEETRREPGCLGYDLFRSKKNIYKNERTSSYFILQEKWKGQEAINEHLSMPFFEKFMKNSEKLFDGGFEVTAKISGPSRNSSEISEGNVKLVVKMKAKTDKIDVIKRGILEMKTRLSKLHGFIQCDIYQGLERLYDTSVFISDQTWKNKKSLENAIKYILTEMPFYFEDLEETREPIIFEMASEPALGDQPENISLSENAVLGDTELVNGLKKMNPAFAELCLDTSGRAYGTPLIDQRTKILMAITIDIVEQIHGKPFENHLMMAKKQGITREELEELLLFLTVYTGFNKPGAFYAEIAKFYTS